MTDKSNTPQGRENWSGRGGPAQESSTANSNDELSRLTGLLGSGGNQQSHFIVEHETRVIEVITNSMGRSTVLIRRQDMRTYPKQSYTDCERDCDTIRDTLQSLNLKRDSESSVSSHSREKVAA